MLPRIRLTMRHHTGLAIIVTIGVNIGIVNPGVDSRWLEHSGS